jgi:hypothetical protein
MIESHYPSGTVGHTQEIAEQEGKDAWLAGFAVTDNPYVYDENWLAHLFWAVGWSLANREAWGKR